MMRLTAALAILVSMRAVVCAQAFDPKPPVSVPEVSGDVVQAYALRYIDVEAGTGAPAAAGKLYSVHYTGWLRDGTKFDSSRDRNEPIAFVQGRRQVIPGWDAGFGGMKVGGKRRLFIPYQLAYGEQGSGPIPPKAELIFDVELMDVKDAPQTPAAVDVLMPFSDLRGKVMALAKAVPEDKYGWRPAPGVRSFGEVFLHVAYGSKLLLSVATVHPSKEELEKQIEENAKGESATVTKERVVQLLEESFAEVQKSLDSARTGGLNRETDYFGKQTTQRGVFTFLDTHLAEHLGQAIAYARVNGIVPPWSR